MSGLWYAGPVAQALSTAATIGARSNELRMTIPLRYMDGVTRGNRVIWIGDHALVSVQSGDHLNACSKVTSERYGLHGNPVCGIDGRDLNSIGTK
jgi:hypothetical protein